MEIIKLEPASSQSYRTVLCKTNLDTGQWDYLFLYCDFCWFKSCLHTHHFSCHNLTSIFFLKGLSLTKIVTHSSGKSHYEPTLRHTEKTAFTLLFSFIHLSNTPASTSALATTCGSTQLVLAKEPRGRHYNKAKQRSCAARLNTGPLFGCT